MNEKYSALFTPWKIGNVEIKNRIVQPSMGGTSLFGWLEPCHFDKEAAYHILNRAQNNVGLVLPGMQCVRDTMGGRWLYQNKKMFKDLAEWLPEFHKTGSKLFVQLSAGMGRSMAINEIMVKMLQNKAFGAVGKPFLNVDYITASASATPNRWYPECKSRPLTVEEIHEMVDAFAKTAKLLQDAGVDGVEIHAVHEGYLLDQFTIANMNYRTDEYGGSFENRYRFAVEIVQAIKAVCGKDFPVALRYSVDDEQDKWENTRLTPEQKEQLERARARARGDAPRMQDFDNVDDYFAAMRQRAEAERKKRMRNVPKEEFEGTEALQDLGIKIENSAGLYQNVEQMIENDKAAKKIQREIRRAEKRLSVTPKEKSYAAGIAAGIYDADDIPSRMNASKVMSRP